MLLIIMARMFSFAISLQLKLRELITMWKLFSIKSRWIGVEEHNTSITLLLLSLRGNVKNLSKMILGYKHTSLKLKDSFKSVLRLTQNLKALG